MYTLLFPIIACCLLIILVAKKKSLFDDRPTEIQELTYIIKGDISSLNQQIARLGEMPRGRHSMHSHSSSVVLALQSRLASMSNQFKQVIISFQILVC